MGNCCESCFASSTSSSNSPEYEAIPQQETSISPDKSTPVGTSSYQHESEVDVNMNPMNNNSVNNNSMKTSQDSSFTPVTSPAVKTQTTPPPSLPAIASVQKPVIQLDQVNSSNLELTPSNLSNISNISNTSEQKINTPIALETPSPLSPITPVVVEEQFDPNWSIFEGLEIKQKFNNKSTYDSRFIWVSLNTRTIHMSQYMTKERRHKEASLNDVTEVTIGYPEKMKPNTKASEVGDVSDAIKENCCLTITFKRGGGIDLLFNNVTDRDLWFNAIKRIIMEFKK